MAKNYQDIDGLIQGIDTILSKQRYSLTKDEVDLLESCKKELREQRKSIKIDFKLLLQILEMFARFFSDFDI